jgi:carbonic anhydrase
MTDANDLVRHDAGFAATAFRADLTINPSGNMMVIGCVDPRVDRGHVLGPSNREAAIIRNVGGRITPQHGGPWRCWGTLAPPMRAPIAPAIGTWSSCTTLIAG